MCCKLIKKLCLKIFPEEKPPARHSIYQGSEDDDETFRNSNRKSINPNRMSIKSARSASTVQPWENRARRQSRSNSIFGDRNACLITRRESLEKENRRKTSLKSNSARTKPKYIDDPVRDKWANKGSTVYTAFDLPSEKPTKYWVQTELQYVIRLPTERRKLKSKVHYPQGSVTSLPSQLNEETPSKSTPRQSSPYDTRTSLTSNPRKSLPSDTRQSLSSDPKLSQPPSKPTSVRKSRSSSSSSSNPTQITDIGTKNKSIPLSKKANPASSSGPTSSDSSFQPRAAAKPAPKAKGRFCCAKRQDSG